MKSKITCSCCGVIARKIVPLLSLLIVMCDAVADEDQSQPQSECGALMAHQRSARPAYFLVQRHEDGFAYKCTLRKNKYRTKNRAEFQQECESFVNDYIQHVNRCEDADISMFALDESLEDVERQESQKFLIYSGLIGS